MAHTLETRGLSMSYGKRYVVNNMNITLKTGEVVGLLGPNGAGKTTTFYMVVGMLTPECGDIMLDGNNIKGLSMYQRAKKGIGYLPQEPSIFKKLSVRKNLKAVLEINRKGRSANPGSFASIDEEVDKLLEEFNLKEFADRNSDRLSGGQRRRTEIARAIAVNPIFILFDEPFAGIDPIAIIELKKMMNYLKSKGLGILITDHNVRDTLSITDRAYIINNGSVLAEGLPDELIRNTSVKEAYLGDGFRL